MSLFFLFFFLDLRACEHVQEQEQRERESQSRLPAERGTLMWGSDPRTLRSGPEQKELDA